MRKPWKLRLATPSVSSATQIKVDPNSSGEAQTGRQPSSGLKRPLSSTIAPGRTVCWRRPVPPTSRNPAPSRILTESRAPHWTGRSAGSRENSIINRSRKRPFGTSPRGPTSGPQVIRPAAVFGFSALSAFYSCQKEGQARCLTGLSTGPPRNLRPPDQR